jgi:ATP synthase F1 delta subunit
VARKKFHTEKWAEAFLDATGENAEKTLVCLKALSSPVKSMHGYFFGHSASLELEKIMRDCLTTCEANGQTGVTGDYSNDISVEYAIRFICLLVEKKCFRYVSSLIRRIEHKLDEQKGILTVTVETAAAMDGDFEKELAGMIKEKTGAADIRIINRVRPELFGGYLLRIGGFFIDASLKGQLERLRADVFAAGRQ